MKKFKFHEKFSSSDVQRYPNGWILRNDLGKYRDQLLAPGRESNLIGKLIFVDPGTWGDDVLRSEYWKEKTYHPSLSKMKIHDVEKNIVFVGKIIKKKLSIKKRKKDIYETLLMINSAQQFNEFDDEQCRKMININGNISETNEFRNTKNNNVKQMTENVRNSDVMRENESEIEQVVSTTGLQHSKINKKKKRSRKLPTRNNLQTNMNEKRISSSSCPQNINICEKTKDKRVTDSKNDKNHDKLKTVSKTNMQSGKRNKTNNQSDFILQQVVAFDFQDKYFSNRLKSEMANAEVPDDSLTNDRYLVGHVFERMAKKKGAQFHNYKVAFEYSGDGMKEMEFTLEEIVGAMTLNNNIKKMSEKLTNSKKEEEHTLPEHSNIRSIYDFNANDVEGDALESDEEFEEDEMKHIRHRLNEGNCYFETFQSEAGNKHFVTDQLMDCFGNDKIGTLECNRGLTWKKNEEIEAPSGLLPDRKSYLKEQYKNKFKTEIESLLAFLPIPFWVHHLRETNKYMRTTLAKNDSMKSDNGSGNQYKYITLDELMIFYAIIIQMAMKPNPGSRYTECWKNENKSWYTACNNMSKNRFQEIRASLHWCDNGLRNNFIDKNTRKKDTLYKIRPLLGIIEANLGKYLTPCTELSLDETCVAIRSQWARAVTYYNPNKPKGKHHLKFYTVCENSHWCALEIKMCHRFKKDEVNVVEASENNVLMERETHNHLYPDSTSDEFDIIESDVEEDDDYDDTSDDYSLSSLDGESRENGIEATLEIADENIPHPNNNNDIKENQQQSQCETVAQKTVQIVTNLCKNYAGSGRVINMDNLYSSPLVFIKLKEMSLYARGTVRLNRKYLPRFIKYMKKDMTKLPRGSYQFAVNKEYNMSMHCWHDKNPVHVLSTADSTQVEEVSRRSGMDRIVVKCPSTVKNYNKNMQAVDQFNKLMSLFSLAQAHAFTKYYKKIAMVLMDFVLVNSYLHHKLWVSDKFKSSTKKPKFTRKKYMENLIEALIETDWAKAARRYEQQLADKTSGKKRKIIEEMENDDQDEHIFNNMDFDFVTPILPPLQDELLCQAVSFDSKANFFEVKNGDKNKSKFYCRVCQFEGRGNIRRGTVFCGRHGLSLCQNVQGHPKNREFFSVRSNKINPKNITRWDWLSPNQNEWSCWQKAHNYYIPQGLFKTSTLDRINIGSFSDYSGFNFSSSPYLLRKVALENTYYKKVGKKSRQDNSKCVELM